MSQRYLLSSSSGASYSTPTTSHSSLESNGNEMGDVFLSMPSNYGSLNNNPPSALQDHKTTTNPNTSRGIFRKIRNKLFGQRQQPPHAPKYDDRAQFVEACEQTHQATTLSWRIATIFSIAVAILAAVRAKPVYRFYEDRMPEWIWDKNVYISRDGSASSSGGTADDFPATRISLIAQVTENAAMRQFSEVSNRPNRAYARQWQMDYTEYYAGRVSYSSKSCYDKAYVLHTLAEKQRDEARHTPPPPRWPHAPRVRYDAIVLLPSDAIITDMDGDIVDTFLPRNKLAAIAGWTSSRDKLSSSTGIILFNLAHEHAMKVVDLWWKSSQDPYQKCGAANGISTLIDSIASVMDQDAGETLDDLIHPLSEFPSGTVGDHVIKCLPSSVPGARSELFLSNQQQHVETIHQTADSVCYRWFPKCEVAA